MYKTFIALFLILMIYLGCGCSRYVAIKIPCPPPPKAKPVEVINGIVSGQSLDNIIDNWLEIWKYVSEIQKLGCTR
jgi:hypothetical protein